MNVRPNQGVFEIWQGLKGWLLSREQGPLCWLKLAVG